MPAGWDAGCQGSAYSCSCGFATDQESKGCWYVSAKLTACLHHSVQVLALVLNASIVHLVAFTLYTCIALLVMSGYTFRS